MSVSLHVCAWVCVHNSIAVLRKKKYSQKEKNDVKVTHGALLNSVPLSSDVHGMGNTHCDDWEQRYRSSFLTRLETLLPESVGLIKL